MNKDIMDFWPITSPPRENQVIALKWLQENLDKKYFVLEAPVGTGKSLIGVTFASFLDSYKGNNKVTGGSWILTPQKILQDQYIRDFGENEKIKAKSLMGKANYECANAPVSCEIAEAVLKCDCTCYVPAYNEAIKEVSNSVLNYHNMMYFASYNMDMTSKNLVIVDECHNVENILVDFDTIEITARTLLSDMKLKMPIDIEDTKSVHVWIKGELLNAATNLQQDTTDELNDMRNNGNTSGVDTIIRKLQYYTNLCRNIHELPSSPDEFANYYVTYITDKNDFVVKPLYPNNSFKKLAEKGERILLMSGTIPDMEEYCRNLGIPLDEVAFLSMDSEFPPENRKVFYAPVVRMNYNWRNDIEGQNNLVDFINIILDSNKSHKGIIHTTNFQISIWLTEQLENNGTHKIYHHNPNSGLSRDEAISNYIGDKSPSILISPSITEGLDLYEDLARFNIIAKLPYPFLGDAWIRTRKEISPAWYLQKTLVSIFQAVGRTTRSSEDSSRTYILDSSWTNLYNSAGHHIPKWWLDAYEVI